MRACLRRRITSSTGICEPSCSSSLSLSLSLARRLALLLLELLLDELDAVSIGARPLPSGLWRFALDCEQEMW